MPKPSLKLTRNGMLRKPGVCQLHHRRTPGLRHIPPREDWLKRQAQQSKTELPFGIGGGDSKETGTNRLHQQGFPVNLDETRSSSAKSARSGASADPACGSGWAGRLASVTPGGPVR